MAVTYRPVTSIIRSLVCLLAVASVSSAEETLLGWFYPPLRQAERSLAENRAALRALGDPMVGQTVREFGFQHLQMVAPPPESPWVQLDLGSTQEMDLVALVPALVDFQPVARGAYGFPRRFRVDVSDEEEFTTFTPLLVHTDDDFPAPGVAPLVIPAGRASGRYLRVTVTRLAEESGVYFFAMGEIMVLQGNRNIALGATVSGSNSANLAPRWGLPYLVDGRTPLGPPISRQQLPEFDAFFTTIPITGGLGWMAVDLRREVSVDEVRLHPLHARQGADVPGFAFPLQYSVEISATEDFASAVPIFDTGPTDFSNPGNNPVTLPAGGKRGRFVRITMKKSYSLQAGSFALSELEVYVGGVNVARGCRVLSSGDPVRNPPRPPEILVDGQASYGGIVELPQWLDEWSKRAQTQSRLGEIESQIPGLQAGAQRRVLWAGAGVGVAVAGIAVAMAFRSRRSRIRELEEFRLRLARDLHDEIGSNLAGIAVLSDLGAGTATSSASVDEWREINSIASETMDAMREVLWVMGAREEAGFDLLGRMRRVAARIFAGKEIVWRECPSAVPTAMPTNARRQMFLFFKEAVSNASRHANAGRIELAIRFTDRELLLEITDDGRGFDLGTVRMGVGIPSLRERARRLRGDLRVSSSVGQGCTVSLSGRW